MSTRYGLEQKAEIKRVIVETRGSGPGAYIEVAKELNDRGIPTLSGKPWDRFSVSNFILWNVDRRPPEPVQKPIAEFKDLLPQLPMGIKNG